jgi:prephenate dehydratase
MIFHQAALQLGSYNQTQKVELISHPTLTSLFSAVKSGSVHRSVVPVGNSSNGPVKPTLDLLTTASKEQQLDICGETKVLVKQCLAGHRTSNENGAISPYSHITSLHTHPQAWTQCSPFLDKHFDKSVNRIDEDSTSAAAELVSKDQTRLKAAICSSLAAEVFGLQVLAADINYANNNETRFIVLRNRNTVIEQGNRSLLVFQYSSELVDWVDIRIQQLSRIDPPPIQYTYPNDQGLWVFYFWDTSFSTHTQARATLQEDLNSKNIKYYSWGPWPASPEPTGSCHNVVV